MNIPAVGELFQHPDVPEWLVSRRIPVPYFDGLPLEFTFDGLVESDEANIQQAVAAFLSLSVEDRQAASAAVFKGYRQVASAIHPDDLECQIPSAAAVWQHVRPAGIRVARRARRDQDMYVVIEAECGWDPEHGLQIIYRRGSHLSRVSDQDGHLTHADAYDLPEDEDRIA